LRKGLDNHFINLQNQIEKLRKNNLDEIEINNAILLGYEIIHGEAKHMDVRRLAEVILSEKAKAAPLKILEGDSDETNDVYEETEDEEDDSDDEDEEDQADDEPIVSDSLDDVNKKSRSKKIKNAYDDAMEIVKYEKDREKPKVLINRAFSALDSIDLSSKHFRTDEVKEALKFLAEKVNKIIKIIDQKPRK